MFRALRKITIEKVQGCFLKTRRPAGKIRLGSSQGQVALVLILLAAIGLVFFAMALNYQKVSDTKNKTMMAAQQSSSIMASYMASYAQQLSEENLKGKRKYCKSTSVFKSIVLVVLLIIIAIFAPEGYQWAFALAAGMTAAAAIIDATVIQPAITDMWNKAMRNLSNEGYVVELGVQWGLRMAVEDLVEFPDLLDFDFDGVFGWKDPNDHLKLAKDSVSRFPFYYTQRMMKIQLPNPSEMNEFAKQLRSFVYYKNEVDHDTIERNADATYTEHNDIVNVWGLHDPVLETETAHPCNTSNPPSECNEACVPVQTAADACCQIEGCGVQVDAEGEIVLAEDPDDGELYPVPVDCGAENYLNPLNPADRTFPDCCYSCSYPPESISPKVSCGYIPSALVSGACSAPYMPGYQGVYDPFYENTLNNVFSFRENMGRDDESPAFSVQQSAPDWHSTAGLQQIGRTPAGNPQEDYRIEDTSGFWQNDRQVVADGNTGIYPLFYVMQDVGVGLQTLSGPGRYECYWTDATGSCTMDPYNNNSQKNTNIPTLNPLSLDSDFLLSTSGTGVLTTETVANLGNGGTPDVVPDFFPDFFIPDDECGHVLTGDGEARFGWKRGIDKFCSTDYPYNMECTKHGVCTDQATGEGGDLTPEERDCFCGEDDDGDPATSPVDATLFPEDFLDDIYYGIPEFLQWAENFLASIDAGDAGFLRKTIDLWYDSEIADWIEPGCPDNETVDPDTGIYPCVPFCGPHPDCEQCGGDKKDDYCRNKTAAQLLHACCPGSVTKLPREGRLYTWRRQLDMLYDELTKWIWPASAQSYQGGQVCLGSNAVWCIPHKNLGNDCGAPAGEAATFDVNENSVRGDLEDVVACLDWNVNDAFSFVKGRIPGFDDFSTLTPAQIAANTETVTGNEKKFLACLNNCGPWACSELPRSLISQTGPYTNVLPFQSTDKEAYIYCLQSATQDECEDRCSSLPQQNPDGVSYDLPVFIAATDCLDILAKTGAPGSFYASVVALQDGVDDPNIENDEADDTTGSCFLGPGNDLNENKQADFLEWVQASADAAVNQVIKLRQRHVFLDYLFREGERVRGIIGEAVDRISEFLDNHTPWEEDGGPGPDVTTAYNGAPGGAAEPFADTQLDTTVPKAPYTNPERERVVRWSRGYVKDQDNKIDYSTNVYAKNQVDSPAELLIAMRSNNDPVKDKGDLSSVAVYVWRGPDLESPREGGSNEGYVHAVKVEVRAPKRCNFACDITGTRPVGRWPWIKTKTSRMGTKRCYYLMNYTGRVKSRVIRYDEPIHNTNKIFRFANNVPIWGMRTTHPESGEGTATIFNEGGSCYAQIHPIIKGIGEYIKNKGVPAPQRLHHAFMLDDVPIFAPSDGSEDQRTEEQQKYAACWKLVHEQLLKNGIHSESCAIYRWEAGDMGVRFVGCDPGFRDGYR